MTDLPLATRRIIAGLRGEALARVAGPWLADARHDPSGRLLCVLSPYRHHAQDRFRALVVAGLDQRLVRWNAHLSTFAVGEGDIDVTSSSSRRSVWLTRGGAMAACDRVLREQGFVLLDEDDLP